MKLVIYFLILTVGFTGLNAKERTPNQVKIQKRVVSPIPKHTCYFSDKANQYLSEVDKLVLNFQDRVDNGNFWVSLTAVKSDVLNSNSFNCVESGKLYTCSGDDDSGSFIIHREIGDQSIKLSIQFLLFGNPDEDPLEVLQKNKSKNIPLKPCK